VAAIVICEFMDEDAITSVLAGHDLLYDAGLVDRRDDLLAALGDARALIVRNRTQVNGELLARAPKLQAVGRLGVGLDNIDMAACKARGVAVYPATGANDISVVEYVVAAMLMLLRGAYGATSAVIDGKWPRTALIGGREANGKRLGIVGFGAIGRKVGGVAAALGSRRAVLMQNHGVFTIGPSAKAAVKSAVMTEDVARTVHIARQIGDVQPIAQADIDSLYARYQNAYGQV